MRAAGTARALGGLLACLIGIGAGACHGTVTGGAPSAGDGGVHDDGGARRVPLSGYASGSRLRARVLDGGGDPIRFEGFVDSKLDVPCVFAFAEDGAVRCLPNGAWITNFADAACSQPVIVAAPGCGAPPDYAAWSPPVEGPYCTWEPRLGPGPQRIVARGAPLASAPMLYTQQGSSCDPTSSPPASGSTVYATNAVAPSTFVAAKQAIDPRGARVAARVLLADDGAAEVFGYFDESEHAACDVIQESIGWHSDLCIPTTMAWANDWADAACTQVAAHIGRRCPKPTIAVDASTVGNCYDMQTIHAYAIGAPIATAYVGSAGRCGPLSPDPNGDVTFAVAGAVDPATFPAVGIEPAGASELRTYFRTSPDGVPILPAGLGILPNSEGPLFRDMPRDADCWGTQLADGSWRCLPTAYAQLWGDTRYYADASCTQELVDAGDFSPPCAPPAPVVALRIPGPTCGGDTRVQGIYALGASMPGGSVYSVSRTGGPCQPTSLPSSDKVYALGAPIDPASFPLLTERTE